MFRKRLSTCVIIAILLLCSGVTGKEYTEEELEKWFNSDKFEPPDSFEKEVNDGSLIFLEKLPDDPVHHHYNALTIQPTSLQDGWVKLKQCHENLDAVGSAQIVFSKNKVRDITVYYSKNIGRAWVENSSVQMEDIKPNAKVCLSASTRTLVNNKDGSFSLHTGPFMRKFLDGYYPMHVTMDVVYAGTGLKLLAISPVKQKGFNVLRSEEQIQLDTWFEGELRTELLFTL